MRFDGYIYTKFQKNLNILDKNYKVTYKATI